MGRDVCSGRGDAKGLMESSLDGHGALSASTEATRFARVASVEMDEMKE